jgi:ATP-dependent Lon protease
VQQLLPFALDNGAQRALLPIGNKSQAAGLPEDVVERLDIVFYGDPDRAVSKDLEV